MSKLVWYWHRLLAMRPSEIVAHGRKAIRQRRDQAALPDWSKPGLGPTGAFPRLPATASFPEALRPRLRAEVENLLAGHWRAFGWMPLQVEDPPRWQKDYFVGVDLHTAEWGSRCNHRAQSQGADIKIIWEPNRWNQLVRLAQGAYLLEHEAAAMACMRWLEEWDRQNPPFRGLNWTSALETGLRLIQLAWMDALLSGATLSLANSNRWKQVRASLMPRLASAHAHYTWHYRSFGSSANNHLLGELAGLVIALCRWPSLAVHAAPLRAVRALWETETVRQFAPDGGNREQALGYHWFSWEFCWQARAAVHAGGETSSPEIDDRLQRAATFYAELKPEADPWDFGDSDNAWVTPFYADESQVPEEWRAWLKSPASSPGIDYWWGADRLPLNLGSARGVTRFADSGYVVWREQDWELRWDLSPLGYLATAAHGHLDALHLSVRIGQQPLIIDPGTGAYYADPGVRAHLASWAAHNGPHWIGAREPARRGTFLWGAPHHPQPIVVEERADTMTAELALRVALVRRTITRTAAGWRIEDQVVARQPAGVDPAALRVCWRLAPEVQLASGGNRQFVVGVGRHRVRLEMDSGWSRLEAFAPDEVQRRLSGTRLADLGGVPLEAVCSPAFRLLRAAPFVSAQGHPAARWVTTIERHDG
jgi:hypothetical protein